MKQDTIGDDLEAFTGELQDKTATLFLDLRQYNTSIAREAALKVLQEIYRPVSDKVEQGTYETIQVIAPTLKLQRDDTPLVFFGRC